MEVNRPLLKHLGFIYKIINISNNKIYIGQTTKTINRRFKLHCAASQNIKTSSYNSSLSRAIRKYGIASFKVVEVQRLYATTLPKLCIMLDCFEKRWIKKTNSNSPEFGYNLTSGGLVKPQNVKNYIVNRILYSQCCIEGCNNPHNCHGYCSTHYNLILKFGTSLPLFNRFNHIRMFETYAEMLLENANREICAATKIDLDDIEKISVVKWHLNKRQRGIGVGSTLGMLHNYILDNTDANLIVYHINGDNLDNRKENLRLMSRAERLQLSYNSKRESDQLCGISYIKPKLHFQVKVKLGKIWKFVGNFKTIEEAISIRDKVNTDPEKFFEEKRIRKATKKTDKVKNKKQKCIGCSVSGCNNKHLANGLCQKHYNLVYKYGDIQPRTSRDYNEILYTKDFAEIVLYNAQNKECGRTKVDVEDIPKLEHLKWHLSWSARGLTVAHNNKVGKLHTFLMSPPKDSVILHINGDGLDNRKSNLKIASKSEQHLKSPIQSNNKSGHKGVWFCKDRNKWLALITINHKTKALGRFDTFEEAVIAREQAEQQYYA